MTEHSKLKRNIIIISILLFLFSLTRQCYCTTSQCADSIMAFLLGFFALFTGGAGISWLANPLLIAAWVMLKKNVKTAMYLSLLAFIFAGSFLLNGSVLANEAGHYQQIVSIKEGYWLWLASCFTTLGGTFLLMLKQNESKRNGMALPSNKEKVN